MMRSPLHPELLKGKGAPNLRAPNLSLLKMEQWLAVNWQPREFTDYP